MFWPPPNVEVPTAWKVEMGVVVPMPKKPDGVRRITSVAAEPPFLVAKAKPPAGVELESMNPCMVANSVVVAELFIPLNRKMPRFPAPVRRDWKNTLAAASVAGFSSMKWGCPPAAEETTWNGADGVEVPTPTLSVPASRKRRLASLSPSKRVSQSLPGLLNTVSVVLEISKRFIEEFPMISGLAPRGPKAKPLPVVPRSSFQSASITPQREIVRAGPCD